MLLNRRTGAVLVLILLAYRRRQKTRRYLLRRQIPTVTKAAWYTLKTHPSDRGYLSTMGLDMESFEHLTIMFRIAYAEVRRPRRHRSRGRPALLQPDDILALVLHYLSSKAEQHTIGRLFGLTASSTSQYIWNGMHVLLLCLRTMSDSRIVFPKPHEMKRLADILTITEPALKDVFGFVDGLNCPIRDPQEPLEQNAYYIGWLAGCFVSSVILYCVDGTILWVNFNAPGSWHDSKISRSIYEKLISRCPAPFEILADTAFPRNEELHHKILSLLKDSEIENLQCEEKEVRAQSHIITSIRQAAEWGMRKVQAVNPRLRVHLHSYKEK